MNPSTQKHGPAPTSLEVLLSRFRVDIQQGLGWYLGVQLAFALAFSAYMLSTIGPAAAVASVVVLGLLAYGSTYAYLCHGAAGRNLWIGRLLAPIVTFAAMPMSVLGSIAGSWTGAVFAGNLAIGFALFVAMLHRGIWEKGEPLWIYTSWASFADPRPPRIEWDKEFARAFFQTLAAIFEDSFKEYRRALKSLRVRWTERTLLRAVHGRPYDVSRLADELRYAGHQAGIPDVELRAARLLSNLLARARQLPEARLGRFQLFCAGVGLPGTVTSQLASEVWAWHRLRTRTEAARYLGVPANAPAGAIEAAFQDKLRAAPDAASRALAMRARALLLDTR